MPAPLLDYRDYALIPQANLLNWYYALSFIRSIYEYKIKDYEALNIDTTYAREQLQHLGDMLMFFTMAKDCYLFGSSGPAHSVVSAEAES